jgi:predicted Holliday junction resolvase-like endonuclease
VRKTLYVGAMIALVFTMNGCGSNADGLMSDMIRCMNDMADAMEKKAPEEKLTEIKTRMENIGKKLDALKLSEDEKKKLLEKHKDAMEKAAKRITDATMKNMGGLIPGMPSVPKFGNSP